MGTDSKRRRANDLEEKTREIAISPRLLNLH
jgi:hypothetical protein